MSWTISRPRQEAPYVSLIAGFTTQPITVELSSPDGEVSTLRLTPSALCNLVGVGNDFSIIRDFLVDLSRNPRDVTEKNVIAARSAAIPEDWRPLSASAFMFGRMPPTGSEYTTIERAVIEDYPVAILPRALTQSDELPPDPPRPTIEFPIRIEPLGDGIERRIMSHEYQDGRVLDLSYRVASALSGDEKQLRDLGLQGQLRHAIKDGPDETRWRLRDESNGQFDDRQAAADAARQARWQKSERRYREAQIAVLRAVANRTPAQEAELEKLEATDSK